MFTASGLIELHKRTHKGFAELLEHCRMLSADELHREITGFGYPTVQLQLHHVIGAEEYWFDVLAGRYAPGNEDFENEARPFADIDALEAYRAKVAMRSADWLATQSDEELNTPREMLTWPGNRRMLHPAFTAMRPITHSFHHRGQVMAMLRLMGKEIVSIDLPIAAE